MLPRLATVNSIRPCSPAGAYYGQGTNARRLPLSLLNTTSAKGFPIATPQSSAQRLYPFPATPTGSLQPHSPCGSTHRRFARIPRVGCFGYAIGVGNKQNWGTKSEKIGPIPHQVKNKGQGRLPPLRCMTNLGPPTFYLLASPSWTKPVV